MSDLAPSGSGITPIKPETAEPAQRQRREPRISGPPLQVVRSFGYGQIDMDRFASIVRKILDGAGQ